METKLTVAAETDLEQSLQHHKCVVADAVAAAIAHVDTGDVTVAVKTIVTQ